MREVIKGLLTCNFRSWGPTQFRQYHSLFGHCGHCGIEIEFKTSNCPKLLGKPWIYTRALKCDQGGYFVEAEVTRLYDVTNPILFVKELRQSWSELLKAGIDMSGSLHVNHQWERAKPAPFMSYSEGKLDIDSRSPDGRVRLECKKGVCSYNWEDILVQMINSYPKIRVLQNISDKKLALKKAFLDYYPVERQMLSRINFLDPVKCEIINYGIW